MATISIDIPNASLTRVVDGLCNAYGYDLYVETGGTQTRNQFAKQQIINFVKQTVKNQEGGTAAETARQSKQAEIETINIT